MAPPTKRPLLPAAIDNFAELVTHRDTEGNSYLFVDKTMLIKAFADSGAKVTLITRPRRFGKTLNLSMLQHFFAAEVNGVRTKGLFDGLEVSKHPEVMELQGQHPAIFLTLKSIRGGTYEEMKSSLKVVLRELFTAHRYLLDEGHLKEEEEPLFTDTLAEKASETQDKDALKRLSNLLMRATGKKVMIFLDEYDTPMHEAYVHGYYEACKAFMASFLGEAFKGNPALEKALLTGILKLSQANLFSQFNNPLVDTVLSEDSTYPHHFGFTEEETDGLLDAAGLPKRAHELKEMYNGYQIAGYTLYNPFSIISFVGAATRMMARGEAIDGALQPYWVNTGGRSLIHLAARHHILSLTDDWKQLLTGGEIETEIDPDIIFDTQLQGSPIAFWSLLLMAGYLKKVRTRLSPYKTILYTLKCPNAEVLESFRRILLELLAGGRSFQAFAKPLYALVGGDIDLYTAFLKDYLLDTPSYFNTAAPYAEQFYVGLLLGMCVVLEDRYIVEAEWESGKGRSDISLTPKDKQDNGVILEIKVARAGEDLQRLAEEARLQILDKAYARRMRKKGVQKLIAVGVAFRQKEAEVAWSHVDSDLSSGPVVPEASTPSS